VFKKADRDALDLIEKLLEYTPTQRLSAIDAMVHPFFNELRDPATRLQDSRHPGSPSKDLPPLFDFTLHGMSCVARGLANADRLSAELSIRPDLNPQLVPPHAKAALKANGLDIDSQSFKPLSKEEMMARLD
jgi:glycogen synthase kinase 3 beta